MINSVKIVFVHSRLKYWNELLNNFNNYDTDIPAALAGIRDGRDAWIITAYLFFKKCGLNVEISENFINGSICVSHYDDLVKLKFPYDSYVVSVRADREKSFICDKEIVQSPGAIENNNCIYIPHWPQPNLIPRNPSRASTLQNIGYFGVLRNLAASCRSEEFTKKIEKIGMKLVIKDLPENWNDYNDIDIVLALRDGSDYFLSSKPATKLFNAWIAGCPALVGFEPAYEYHIKDDLDGIFVKDADDIINKLMLLKDSPSLYSSMITRCMERSEAHKHDAVARIWIDIFTEEVIPCYERWMKHPQWLRKLLSIFMYLYRYLLKILCGKKYTRGYDFNGTPIKKRGIIQKMIRKSISILNNIKFRQ